MLYGIEVYDKIGTVWVFDGYAALFHDWHNALEYASIRTSEDTYYHINSISESTAKAGGIYNLLAD